jgi:hypothetical protein
MPEDKIHATPQDESPEDRFEHEIEELESSSFRHNPTLIVAVLVLIVIVGAGITYLFMTEEKKRVKPTGPVVMQIETLEPRSGTLSNTPTKFRWETISATKYYSFTLSGKGAQSALLQRATVSPSVTLTPEELNRLAKGASYTWKVEAFSDTGKVLARGEAAFDL